MFVTCSPMRGGLVGVLVLSVWWQAGADQPGDAQAPADETKRKVLKWVDEYRKVQVLFHDDDLAKLRKELADDTPEEAQRWWTKTEELRAALDSKEWAETRDWFREFLRVQAIFSDEQIEELRGEAKTAAKNAKPAQFKEILSKIEGYRANLVRGAESDRAIREHQVKVLEAYRQRDAAERADAAKAAAFSTNTVRQPAAPRRQPRYPTAPLIDSLDVARWSILRGFWGY